MTELVSEYGYASEGESFSLADKDEVWIMEMIGKVIQHTTMRRIIWMWMAYWSQSFSWCVLWAPSWCVCQGHGEKGAVWVAVRVPDGYVSSHANQARIRTFARDSPEEVLFAQDVVDFAR